jgi:hypothetical protein
VIDSGFVLGLNQRLLSHFPCPDGEIGRHTGLKIRRPKGCAGSTPARGTISLHLASSKKHFNLSLASNETLVFFVVRNLIANT